MCLCMRVNGEVWGSCLGKQNFKKPTLLVARALPFAFQCEVQPPLFMMPYTSKPWPASTSLSLYIYPHSNHNLYVGCLLM